jgi:hypothetical protein
VGHRAQQPHRGIRCPDHHRHVEVHVELHAGQHQGRRDPARLRDERAPGDGARDGGCRSATPAEGPHRGRQRRHEVRSVGSARHWGRSPDDPVQRGVARSRPVPGRAEVPQPGAALDAGGDQERLRVRQGRLGRGIGARHVLRPGPGPDGCNGSQSIAPARHSSGKQISSRTRSVATARASSTSSRRSANCGGWSRSKGACPRSTSPTPPPTR